jgi:hypothetical protein
VSRLISGQDIKTNDKEKACLRDFDKQINDRMDNPLLGEDDFKTKFRDTYSKIEMAQNRNAETALHLNCELCRHCSVGSREMDPQFYNAYELMVDLDREKICYASDWQIFHEMAMVFNTEQSYIKENGGKFFFVTTEHVKTHFLYHDSSNPLRTLNEQLHNLREIRRTGTRHVFGRARGRSYWNTPKTKLLLQVMKQEQAVLNNVAVVRSQINAGYLSVSHMRAPNKPSGGNNGKASRHLTGATAAPRFGSTFLR